MRTFFRPSPDTILIYFNKRAWVIIPLLLGLYLEAYMHNLNLVYILLFFILSLLFISCPIGKRNIQRVKIEFKSCSRIFANIDSSCYLLLSNPSSFPSLLGAKLIIEPNRQIDIEPLNAYKKRDLAISILMPKRGKHPFPNIKIESSFPLGWLRFVKSIPTPKQIVVFPEPKGKPLREFLAKQKSNIGYEADFDGLKSYSGYESASRIHWQSLAKGEMMIKNFTLEGEDSTLVFDFNSAGKTVEERLSQLSLWILEAEQLGLNFTLKLPKQSINSKDRSIDEILALLALY